MQKNKYFKHVFRWNGYNLRCKRDGWRYMVDSCAQKRSSTFVCLSESLLIEIRQLYPQRRNTPHRTNQLPGRSQVMDQFRLYRFKGSCIITHHLQSGVKIVFKKTGHNPSGVFCKVTQNKRFYNDLLHDYFKRMKSTQLTKWYWDTYSLQILSSVSSYAIIERLIAPVL